jgi:hypothetical protein
MEDVAETDKFLQDFVAPELREVSAKLQALADAQKSMGEGKKDLETRILRVIVKSEERILLILQVADLSARNAELTKRLEEKRAHPESSAH